MFFDIENLKLINGKKLKKQRLQIVYDGENRTALRNAIDSGKKLPRSPTQHFCPIACFANNQSFREFVSGSLNRLNKRDIFYRSFIDDIRRKFESGNRRAGKMIIGLISVDIGLEANRL